MVKGEERAIMQAYEKADGADSLTIRLALDLVSKEDMARIRNGEIKK